MSFNFFRGTFEDKNGKRVTKEVKSETKSASQLRKETIDKYKDKGYKYKSGGLGTRSK